MNPATVQGIDTGALKAGAETHRPSKRRRNQIVMTSAPAIGVLLMRLTMGFSFLAHTLYLMLFVLTLPGAVKFLENAGLPGFLAYVVFTVELIVGVCLVIGYQVRWACLAVLPIMAGAAFAHSGAGWRWDAPGGGWEYPVFWMMMLIALACLDERSAPAGSAAAVASPTRGL
jgi:putative oxidoreductase